MSDSGEKKQRRTDEAQDKYMKTLLATPDPPSRLDYAEKKVVLARKMDRMDMAAKSRLQFIKLLHKNNEDKERMITSFNDEKLGRTFDKGLREASDLFDKIKGEHAAMNSIPRRLKIINDFCVNIELQEAKGMLKKDDMDPIPTPEIYDSIAFDSIIPSYNDLLSNKPSPFKHEGEIVDPMVCVTLLQPYLPPAPIKEKRRKMKEKAMKDIAEKKAIEQYEVKRAKFIKRQRERDEMAKDSFGQKEA